MALSTLAVVAKKRRLSAKLSPFYMSLLEDAGRQDDNANQQIYLITVSRALPGARLASGLRDLETLTRAELLDMLRDAFDNPVASTGGGRPRSRSGSIVDAVIVAMERHADGSVHFHVVVRLSEKQRFKLAKQTLQERHKLPSHWSCTHTQLWSALRYVHVATPKKPDVDKDVLQWTCDGRVLDLDEKSKVPFVAVAWRRRRETLEAIASVEGKKAPAFTKPDFTALVIHKHLHTTASLLAYGRRPLVVHSQDVWAKCSS
jgi:hypothetical protein